MRILVAEDDAILADGLIRSLRQSGYAVDCVRGLECCGMPKWEHGDLEGLRSQARHNLDRLGPHVAAGQKVLAINPTCSMICAFVMSDPLSRH